MFDKGKRKRKILSCGQGIWSLCVGSRAHNLSILTRSHERGEKSMSYKSLNREAIYYLQDIACDIIYRKHVIGVISCDINTMDRSQVYVCEMRRWRYRMQI